MRNEAVDVIVRMKRELQDEYLELKEKISLLNPQTDGDREYKLHLIARKAAIDWVIHRFDLALEENGIKIYKLGI